MKYLDTIIYLVGGLLYLGISYSYILYNDSSYTTQFPHFLVACFFIIQGIIEFIKKRRQKKVNKKLLLIPYVAIVALSLSSLLYVLYLQDWGKLASNAIIFLMLLYFVYYYYNKERKAS